MTEVKSYINLMNEVLKSKDIVVSFVKTWFTPDGEIVRDVAIDVDANTLSLLNDELIERLVEARFSDKFLSLFSGSFISES